MPAPTAAATPDLGSRHSDADKEDGDLTSFRQLCHRLYYDKDPTSARKVDQILSRLPAQDRTTYARAMADVRSAYHRDHEIRRRARVEHLLCEVEPASIVKGAIGISPRSNDPSTAAMRSRAARRIRVERFKAFLSTNCHEATVMPGPHPFLRGLFATLWLQTRIPHNGCVEWTVDVAVLTEAGSGETWTRDAVELLKGVLGMSERVQPPQVASTYADSTYTSRLSSAFSDLSSSSPAASRPYEISTSQLPRQPILRSNTTRAPVAFERPPSSLIMKQGGGPPPPVPPHRGSPLRNRAPSDPFLDNKALLPVASDQEEEIGFSSSAAPSPPSSSLLTVSGPLNPLGSNSDLASPTASTPFLPTSTSAAGADRPPDARLRSSKSARPDDPAPIPPPAAALHRPPPPPPRLPPNPAVPPQFRTFTLPPYLTNPELYALLRLFPSFIAGPVRRAVNNRSSSMSTTFDELEEQLSAVVHGEVALASGEAEGGGTTARRSDGWKGTLWERFLLWLRRLFGLM